MNPDKVPVRLARFIAAIGQFVTGEQMHKAAEACNEHYPLADVSLSTAEAWAVRGILTDDTLGQLYVENYSAALDELRLARRRCEHALEQLTKTDGWRGDGLEGALRGIIANAEEALKGVQSVRTAIVDTSKAAQS